MLFFTVLVCVAATSFRFGADARYFMVRMFCFLCSRATALLLVGGRSAGDTMTVGGVIVVKAIVSIAEEIVHGRQLAACFMKMCFPYLGRDISCAAGS